METSNRKSITDDLKKYTFYDSDKPQYIEITEWSNGEGWDIDINGNKLFPLQIGELEAINYLVKYLEYGNTK